MKSKTLIISIAGIFTLLISIYILLPQLLVLYFNHKLKNSTTFQSNISSVSIAVLKGNYSYHSIHINRTQYFQDSPQGTPILEIDQIDINMDWDALRQGKFRSEITLTNPKFNFIASQQQEEEREEEKENNDDIEEDMDWLKTMEEMAPFRINKFQIIDGKINYFDYNTDPPIEFYVDSLYVNAWNLTNVEEPDLRLPATIKADARAKGGGQLKFRAQANLLHEVPNFYAEFKMEELPLTSLNTMTQAYGNFTFEQGTFDMYSEMALREKYLEGYIKPVFVNMRIINWDREHESLLHKLWETSLGLAAKFFRNRPRDKVATNIPFEGPIEELDPGTWEAIFNVFRNAFIEAFDRELDGTIDFEAVPENF
jgi:hypothetical protein